MIEKDEWAAMDYDIQLCREGHKWVAFFPAFGRAFCSAYGDTPGEAVEAAGRRRIELYDDVTDIPENVDVAVSKLQKENEMLKDSLKEWLKDYCRRESPCLLSHCVEVSSGTAESDAFWVLVETGDIVHTSTVFGSVNGIWRS